MELVCGHGKVRILYPKVVLFGMNLKKNKEEFLRFKNYP
jgi:hypothetical protein